MSAILGLSHLVFTINKESEGQSTFLDLFFFPGEFFQFNHQEVRANLIRNSDNATSNLALHRGRFDDTPAIELLYTSSKSARRPEKFGLIYPGIPCGEKLIEDQHFTGGHFFVRYYFDPFLNSRIAVETNFFEKGYGCWLYASDFEEQKSFFLSIHNSKVLLESNDFLIISCKVINKKFSNFTFVIIRDNVESTNFNDDSGLSTVGWITKDIGHESLAAIKLQGSPKFTILLNGNSFDAKFLYNNKSISHELLKLN
jgi:hypothetical protein